MMTNPTGAQLLAKIQPRLTEKGARICLRPDLLDEWHEANDELTKAQVEDSANARLGTGVSAKTQKLAKKVREIETQIEESEVRFLFRAMSRADFQALCDEHPPRQDNQFDMMIGYDLQAVRDAQVRACLIDPVFEDCTEDDCTHADCGTWQQFLSVCNPSEWGELLEVVESVNAAVKAAPKSPLASQILDKLGSTSKRRKPGA